MHEAVFVIDLARSLFATIDRAIYSLIAAIYSIILEISGISFFSSEDISAVSKRIYVFIGVFMLFKVTFSLISYLVNPDNISDKNNGLGNVSKNVIVTLFLIIIVPYAFDLLYSAQNAILKDNLIPRVVLGTDGKGNNSGAQTVVMDKKICSIDGDHATVEEDGQLLALLTFRPFFQVYDDTKDKIDSNAKKEYCTSNSVSNLLSSNLYNDETAILNTGQYIIDYQFLLSTITGVVVFLLLLNFAFDIAARTIKLGFLEIIAPIPILSYIDPKSSKDGPFKKWLSEVGKTWASLFIRLAIVYFAIYAIKLVSDSFDRISGEHTMWITLFLIIGILIFAKNATPLIENIFGIKDHSVQLNPFKKISEQAAGGKQLLGAGTAAGVAGLASAGSALTGGVANVKNRIKSEDFKNAGKLQKFGKGLVSFGGGAIGGTLSGLYNGAKTGYKAGAEGKPRIGKSTLDAMTTASENRNFAQDLIDNGVVKKGPFAKQRFDLHNKYTDVTGNRGSSGTTDDLKSEIKNYTAKQEAAKANMQSALQAMGNLRGANSSPYFQKAAAATNFFNEDPTLDDDGKAIFADIPSFTEFASHSGVGSGRQKAELYKEYTAYVANKEAYRQAYQAELDAGKQVAKLNKSKDKIEKK